LRLLKFRYFVAKLTLKSNFATSRSLSSRAASKKLLILIASHRIYP
jgi:hypothetical protein